MYRASILVICALLGACASNLPEMRPSSSGFAGAGSVMHPLEDGKRHLAAGRNGLAIRRFGEELGRHPRSLVALNGIAIAYARLGRHDVAHTYFERALALDPRDAATLNNYGRSLLEQGRLREAQPFFEQALRYASESDTTVIAENMSMIRRPAPPSLVKALGKEETQAGPRLLRVADNRYHLQTARMPGGTAPTAAGSVAQKLAPPPGGDAAAASLPQKQSGPSDVRPRAVALSVNPPLPRMKPIRLPPPARDGQRAIASLAQPTPVSPDERAPIDSADERPAADPGLGEGLDDTSTVPATGADPFSIGQGDWT